MITVALDAMGGDYAPQAIVQGALRAAAADPDLSIALVGRSDEIRPLLPAPPPNIRLVEAPQVVTMAEQPAASVRQKPHSSIMVGLELVKHGEAQAFLSFGNTGAVMAAGLFTLGRIPGIDRPALGAMFQNRRGSTTLLLDVGANVDCRPLYLIQFALMGKAYFERVLRRPSASVGLLNVGEEESKGNQLSLEAYPLLKAMEPNFVGNVEGKEMVEGVADVVVCDGFAGNVAIKVAEAIAALLVGELKQSIKRRRRYLLAAWFLRGAFRALKERIDYQKIGGAPLFGVNGTVLIGHGRADAEAVASGLRLTRVVAESGFVDAVRTALRDFESTHAVALRAARGAPQREGTTVQG